MRDKERKLCAETAQALLNGEMGLLEGCRILASLCPSRDEEAWATIVRFNEENELFPAAERRSLYAPQYLAKLDQEWIQWEVRHRRDVLAACEWLVREYGVARI